MFLSKIQVKNYKSFRDSGELIFKTGINLIVGENNVGKTALLEALEIKIGNIPHRNLSSPRLDNVPEKSSKSVVYVGITLSGNNVPPLDSYVTNDSGIWQNRDNIVVSFPQRDANYIGTHESYFSPALNLSVDEKNQKIEEFRINKKRSKENLEKFIDLFQQATNTQINLNFKYVDLNMQADSFNYGFLGETINTTSKALALNRPSDGSKWEYDADQRVANNPSSTTYGWNEAVKFHQSLYRFSAERPNLARATVGFSEDLRPDGSNLAEVLQNIQNNNHDVFEEFNRLVTSVIPSVKWVSSVKIEHGPAGTGNWNEIRIWTVDKVTRRNDLAFPLTECGTGIGQILAILCVVIASQEPRTIIIDEPNSFLHPGATKKLIQILNRFPQHQYFISTHSPEVMAAAKASTITRLRYVDGETIAETLDLSEKEGIRGTFLELGVAPSDFFFANNILWVEGETEERALPLILEGSGILDVSVLPVVPSEFRSKKLAKKNARLVQKIYNQLSNSEALVPPQISILLDREDLKDSDITDLKREFGESLTFLDRMMFENYILEPAAITAVLNSEIIDKTKIKVSVVKKFISETKKKKAFLAKNLIDEPLSDSEWLAKVHGANLLENLFSELSNKTVEYRKTTHSVKLTQWLLENKPDQLSELTNFLLQMLRRQSLA